MDLKEAKRVCRLLCGKKNKKGKREYKTFLRMEMQAEYSVDEMADAIETMLTALENSVSKDEIKEILRKYEYDENYTKQEFYKELKELLNKGE